MKAKLLIATGAFALYGLGFLCAALDTADAVGAAEAASPPVGAAAAAMPPATTCTTAGIRGVADGEVPS
jgi:hypothetical protein